MMFPRQVPLAGKLIVVASYYTGTSLIPEGKPALKNRLLTCTALDSLSREGGAKKRGGMPWTY